MREELTYVATDAYIEETARNEFGYVRDGEIHFHFASMDVLRGYTEAEWNALLGLLLGAVLWETGIRRIFRWIGKRLKKSFPSGRNMQNHSE